MKFEPKTEQQVQEEGLIAAGIYDFEILFAEDTFSSKGNEMVTVKIGVIDPEGQERKVTDYLLEAMPLKLRHFAYATGLGPEYERGSMTAEDMKGRTGKCKIIVEAARVDPKTKKEYRAKNTVADYLVPNGDASAALHAPLGGDPRPPAPQLEDSDIPF